MVALHEGIKVGTPPAHIWFTGNGFAAENSKPSPDHQSANIVGSVDLRLGKTPVNLTIKHSALVGLFWRLSLAGFHSEPPVDA
jgi:hypothetical protein